MLFFNEPFNFRSFGQSILEIFCRLGTQYQFGSTDFEVWSFGIGIYNENVNNLGYLADYWRFQYMNRWSATSLSCVLSPLLLIFVLGYVGLTSTYGLNRVKVTHNWNGSLFLVLDLKCALFLYLVALKSLNINSLID